MDCAGFYLSFLPPLFELNFAKICRTFFLRRSGQIIAWSHTSFLEVFQQPESSVRKCNACRLSRFSDLDELTGVYDALPLVRLMPASMTAFLITSHHSFTSGELFKFILA